MIRTIIVDAHQVGCLPLHGKLRSPVEVSSSAQSSRIDSPPPSNIDYQRWHGALLSRAVILISLSVNTFLASLMPKLEVVTLVVHLVGFLSMLVPLVHLSTDHSFAAEVSTIFTDGGG